MKRNTMKIEDTQIDIESVESITTKQSVLYYGTIYKLEIVMKSGHVHSFNFGRENERDTYYNELIQKWINI